MGIVLMVFSRLCLAWFVIYVLFSLRSALWAGARHNCGFIMLEFQAHRARGTKEAARARLLKRMGLAAALALPVSVASFVASVVVS